MRATGELFIGTNYLFGCSILLLHGHGVAGKNISLRFLINSVFFLVAVVHIDALFAKGILKGFFLLAQGEDPVHPDRGNTWAGAFIQ